jgi:hypothetical protein
MSKAYPTLLLSFDFCGVYTEMSISLFMKSPLEKRRIHFVRIGRLSNALLSQKMSQFVLQTELVVYLDFVASDPVNEPLERFNNHLR